MNAALYPRLRVAGNVALSEGGIGEGAVSVKEHYGLLRPIRFKFELSWQQCRLTVIGFRRNR